MLMDPIHVHATVGLMEVVIFVQVVYTVLAIIYELHFVECFVLQQNLCLAQVEEL